MAPGCSHLTGSKQGGRLALLTWERTRDTTVTLGCPGHPLDPRGLSRLGPARKPVPGWSLPPEGLPRTHSGMTTGHEAEGRRPYPHPPPGAPHRTQAPAPGTGAADGGHQYWALLSDAPVHMGRTRYSRMTCIPRAWITSPTNPRGLQVPGGHISGGLKHVDITHKTCV